MQFQFPPSALKQLSEIIVKHYPRCSVFVFGYRSSESTNSTSLFSETVQKRQHHFDLLMLASQTMPFKGVDIVKVCMLALETETRPNRIPEPNINISGVLAIILDLIAYEEAELMN